MVETHPDFWDCECPSDYIHQRTDPNAVCEHCGAREEDQPDSRPDEIRRSNLAHLLDE